jgi:acetyltransferase-like isoleucine patch superfamily enzyme
MRDAAHKPFTVDRVLVVSDTIEQLKTNERLVALVKARVSRPMSLTVWLRAEPRPDGARNRIIQLLQEVASPATAGLLDVRVADRAEPVEGLLQTHEALLVSGSPSDKALIIAAWQHGLWVVNSLEEAERLATFEEYDFHTGHGTGGTPRWYSIIEGSPVIVTNPQLISLAFGARINPRAVIINESEIKIGRGSLMGADAELNLYYAKLIVGQFSHTSSYFTAVGSRHTLQYPATFSVSRGPYAFLGETADKVADIVIGNDVWIGVKVVVLPGIHIADGCVVGAGSIVTKSLTEPYGIYAGNPAKLIRFRFPSHVIKWLCGIQWWNWPTLKLWEARSFFKTDISGKSEEELWRLIGA